MAVAATLGTSNLRLGESIGLQLAGPTSLSSERYRKLERPCFPVHTLAVGRLGISIDSPEWEIWCGYVLTGGGAQEPSVADCRGLDETSRVQMASKR